MLYNRLPLQFATRYDYEFVYAFFCAVEALRHRAKNGDMIRAHTVMEELAINAIIEAGKAFMDGEGLDFGSIGEGSLESLYAKICGNSDLRIWLYSTLKGPVPPGHPYHFDCWLDQRPYCD